MKKKIAIIGSGIGGLTAANLLIKNSDFEVIVYEKEKMLSLEEGYGIQLAPNSISILNKIGFRNINNNDIFNPLKLDFFLNKFAMVKPAIPDPIIAIFFFISINFLLV